MVTFYVRSNASFSLCWGFTALALVLTLGSGASAQTTAKPVKNAIIVSLDSLRADHLSLYGYPRATTPFLTALAEKRGALVFERATAVSPACHPSHTAMLLGLYPQQVGVPWCAEDLMVKHADFENPEDARGLEALQREEQKRPTALAKKRVSAIANWIQIPQTNDSAASFLRARGFRTGGFVSIWTLHHRFGYNHGFERFVDDMPEYYGPAKMRWLLRDTFRSQRRQVGSLTVDHAINYLSSLSKDDRFFLFLNLADTHVPYAPRSRQAFQESDEEKQRLKELWSGRYPDLLRQRAFKAMAGFGNGFLLDRYDQAIHYTDSEFARLVRFLEQRQLLDDTLLVVTSDHGDSMGQHLYLSGAQKNRLFFEHSVYVWEETQHIPLIVFDPAARGIERRTVNASLVDVTPTVISRLGFDPADFKPGPLAGLDLTNQPDEPRTVYFLTFGRGRPGILKRSFQEYPKFIGWRRGDIKFFVDRDRFRDPSKGRCFFYHLDRDPNELENLCDDPANRETAAAYRRILVDWYDRSVAGRKKGSPPAWEE